MGLMKRINTALTISKALVSYSPEDRKAIRALITRAKDVREYQRRIFQQPQPDNSGPMALLALFAEGEEPVSSEQNYLVIDKTTGRVYYVYYDGLFVVQNGRQYLLTSFNKGHFRWFRIPKIKSEDLIDL